VADESVPDGLYDLHVQAHRQRFRMPHAVGIVSEAETLTLLHCSDLHLLKPTPGGEMRDRSAMINVLVARANAVCPNLVVCTGDLVQRYDGEKKALPPEQIRCQICRVKDLLLQIRVPFYVTLGNHDAAFEATRADWYEAMGGGWSGGTDDYSVDVGAYHLVMMDCFAHYDPQNVQLESSFTPGQLQWLRKDLSASSQSRFRIVFAHYDYRGQLSPLLDEPGIDALFYGHSGPLYPERFRQSGVLDGHLADDQAYSLLTLKPDGIAVSKMRWADL
jgi:predicted MPP superfamily phosphohydrolase